MTNEEILTKMEEEIHLRGLSHHTREEYITRAKIAMRYFNCPLDDLNVQDLRQFLLYLLDEKNCLPAPLMVTTVPSDLFMVLSSVET